MKTLKDYRMAFFGEIAKEFNAKEKFYVAEARPTGVVITPKGRQEATVLSLYIKPDDYQRRFVVLKDRKVVAYLEQSEPIKSIAQNLLGRLVIQGGAFKGKPRLDFSQPRSASVAHRFLHANRLMTTSWLLSMNTRSYDTEIKAKNLKDLRNKMYDVLYERHGSGMGLQAIEINNRLTVNRDGEIEMDYVVTDGNGNTYKDYFALTLLAENNAMRTSELAKPADISAFKKMIEGQKI